MNSGDTSTVVGGADKWGRQPDPGPRPHLTERLWPPLLHSVKERKPPALEALWKAIAAPRRREGNVQKRHTLRLDIRQNAMNLILALFRPLF